MGNDRKLEHKSRFNTVIKEIISWIGTIGVSFIIALFIIGNIGSMRIVSGASMEPSFYDRDKVVLDRVGYKLKDIETGDVVVLNPQREKSGIIYNMYDEFGSLIKNINFKFNLSDEADQDNMIKRVVAIEGDIVDFIDGELYVNDQRETRVTKQGETFEIFDYVKYPLEIGENQYFVLGDNRENSLDSRVLGIIDEFEIKGRVIYRFLPLDRRGKIE